MTMHTHRCGLSLSPELASYGCGHVWTHERNPEKTLVEDHMCPRCGKGPWFLSVGRASNAARQLTMAGIVPPGHQDSE